MPKVFTDLRASETMNAESDLLSFSSITASPVQPLSVDCAGELKVGGANAFYTPGGRLNSTINKQTTNKDSPEDVKTYYGGRDVRININDIKIINIYDFSLISMFRTFIDVYLVTH